MKVHRALLVMVTACGGTPTSTHAPPPVASVQVTPVSATLLIAHTVQLTATARDVNGNVLTERSVSWSTDNAAVATVVDGLVTATVLEGDALIKATVEGQAGVAPVSVIAHPASVTVTPDTAIILLDQSLQLSATVTDSAGNVLSRSASWRTGDPASTPFTVTNQGFVTGHDLGFTYDPSTHGSPRRTVTAEVLTGRTVSPTLVLGYASIIVRWPTNRLIILGNDCPSATTLDWGVHPLNKTLPSAWASTALAGRETVGVLSDSLYEVSLYAFINGSGRTLSFNKVTTAPYTFILDNTCSNSP